MRCNKAAKAANAFIGQRAEARWEEAALREAQYYALAQAGASDAVVDALEAEASWEVEGAGAGGVGGPY